MAELTAKLAALVQEKEALEGSKAAAEERAALLSQEASEAKVRTQPGRCCYVQPRHLSMYWIHPSNVGMSMAKVPNGEEG
jgi:hypothetical protein